MYKLEPLILQLVNPFGTNHSVTTTRTNAYLEVKHLDVVGIAEVGLPPKKENCYFTDYHDIEQFFKIFSQIAPQENYNAFQQFQQTEYFKTQDGLALDFLNQQLSRLDQIENDNIHLASKALFECALIDWYCKYNKQYVAQFIGFENYQNMQIPKMRNFFTLSLLEDVDEVLKQLQVGFPFTPNLKIKVGSNLNYVKEILLGIYHSTIIKYPIYPGLLSIDCNSSWSPEIALQFLNMMNNELKELKPYLYMIEQPFPLIFEKDQWYSVKQKYIEQGIEIFADESIKTYQDVVDLKEVVSGVNIKLEKSSGYRGAVQNFIKASELKLNKWVGIMIGSSLVANQAINLLGLASVGGDIDGTLLVKEECHKVQQHFIWFDQNTENWGLIKLQ